jgi:hypothetical protein
VVNEHVVVVTAPQLHVATMKRAFNGIASSGEWERLDIRIVPPRHRGSDPTIQVALLNLASGALGALLTGVLSVANSLKASKIVIKRADGSMLEFPADYKAEQIARISALLEKNPPESIEIARD